MIFFLGVDAGGSKTRAVVMDENSQIKAEAFGGPANYHNIGLDEVKQNVLRTIENALSKAFLKESTITWCGIGITALDTPKDFIRLQETLTSDQLGWLKNKITLVNDTKIGLYSGTLPPGIVVICGTGSNVYGKNAHGDEALAGNWGYFLGDNGSGFVLAKRMFQTVVEAYEGIAEATILTEKLGQKIGVASPEDISDWYNETQPTVHMVSDFAPLVIETAEAGDDVARELVESTIAVHGKALMSVVKRLKMEDEYIRVVIVGGLFESRFFRAVFEGHVTALLKRVRIVKPLVSPAVGAAILAKHEWEKYKIRNSKS